MITFLDRNIIKLKISNFRKPLNILIFEINLVLTKYIYDFSS